jgi:hypothetical protein
MQQYLKALYGAAVACAGGVELALVDNTVSLSEWAHIAAVTLAALAVIWAVPNKSA